MLSNLTDIEYAVRPKTSFSDPLQSARRPWRFYLSSSSRQD
jgi:hypothetical protein